MKTTHPLPLSFPIDTLRSDNSVEVCHNLRPARGNTVLVPTGTPRAMTDVAPPGSRLLPGGAFRDADDTLALFFDDGEGLLCLDGEEIYRPEGASGSPRCAVTLGDRLMVFCSEGEAPLILSRGTDGRWRARSAAELPPPLTVGREDRGLISVSVDAMKLRGAYSSRSASLTAADLSAVRKTVTDAYLAVGDRAVGRRVFFQPVIVRYRLRGADGSVLYTSAPVFIGPDSGVQLTGFSFSLGGDGFNETGATTVSARAFSLRLSGRLDGIWASVVSSVELQASPQLHPLEESLHASHSLGAFTTGSAVLSVRLPGAPDAGTASAGAGTLLVSQVGAILARLDSGALETVGSARFDAATGEWEGPDSPWYADRRDCRDELKALRAVMSAPVSRPTAGVAAMRALSAPHVLSAAVAGVSGDLIVLGGLSAGRFSGPLPQELAVELRQGQGGGEPVAVKVVFADGSSVVRDGVGLPTVSRLSPLLTYPSPDAVEMRIYCGTSALKVSLRPDPSGTMAYWLHPSGAPVGLTESLPAFVLPAASPAAVSFPGMIAVSSPASPLVPLAVTGSAGAAPVAVTAAAGSPSGWDSGSGRFYLFGPSGIQTLTVSAARNRLTVRTIDRRPVLSAGAVCETGSSVAALAGDDFVTVASQRVTTVLPSAGASLIGYAGARNELWCFPAEESGSVVVASPDGRVRFTRSAPSIASVLSVPPGLWAADGQGRVFDLVDEQDAETEIAYRASVRVAASDRRAGSRIFVLPFRGEAAAGTIELRADNGCGEHSRMLAKYEIGGLFTHLPPVAVMAPHCHRFTLRLTATVRPRAFRLDGKV